MKAIVLCVLLALCGCDHPESWEFRVYAPPGATPERLLEISRVLESNGYRRVRISVADAGRAALISATKSEGGAK